MSFRCLHVRHCLTQHLLQEGETGTLMIEVLILNILSVVAVIYRHLCLKLCSVGSLNLR